MPVKPAYLAMAGAGAIIAISGLKGWGLGKSFRDVIKGQNPAVNPQSANQIQAATFGGVTVTPGTGGIAGHGVANAQGYVNPFSQVGGLVPSRVDQGVDYAGAGPILAIGAGRITSVLNPGWQPGGAFICIRLSEGPYRGKYVYFAEQITPQVMIGQRVKAGQQIGVMQGVIECGWALPPGLGFSMALVHGQFSGSNTTAYGASFNRLLQATGAPSGIINNPPTGVLIAGYP